MSNSIRTNIAAQDIQRNIRKSGLEQDTEFHRLSSGKRITKGADDPAGLAIGTRLEAHLRGYRQATRNANSSVSLVQTAEGSLNEVSNILVRLRELSVQAASDTYGDLERELIDKEYQSLVEEVDRIAQSTMFNGTSLLNGENDTGEMRFQVGAFGGDENAISYDVNAIKATASHLGIDGLGVSDKDSAVDSLDTVDEALTFVAEYRAHLGAIQSRVQSTVNHLEEMTINQDKARAQFLDADIPETVSNLASISVLQQAGISSLAAAHRDPQQLLRLIG